MRSVIELEASHRDPRVLLPLGSAGRQPEPSVAGIRRHGEGVPRGSETRARLYGGSRLPPRRISAIGGRHSGGTTHPMCIEGSRPAKRKNLSLTGGGVSDRGTIQQSAEGAETWTTLGASAL